MAVSLFLAFSLTNKFCETDALSSEETARRQLQYNLILAGIIFAALGSAFIGKWISVKIFMAIDKRLHDTAVRKVLHTGIVFFEENT